MAEETENLKERKIFGKIVNFLPDTNQFIIAVDNNDYESKEILSIYYEEIREYYSFYPKLMLNRKIYCEGTETIDESNCKWLDSITKLEILVDIDEYLI